MDKELLFKPRLPEDEVEVAGVGTVRVRGLNRREALMVQQCKGTEAQERRILSLGLVDPRLTEDEVKQWQAASPAGEIEPVTTRISELSGMTPTRAKEVYREMEADPEAEFRALPGAEAGDDGSEAARGDAG